MRRFGFFLVFFIVAAYFWFVNSVSVFGGNYPVTEVYPSFCSSAPVKVSGELSFAAILFRCGEGFTADENFDAEKFFFTMKAKTVFTENCNGVFCIYAYTPEIDNYVLLNGKKINLHVAVNAVNGETKVASPVIFGSF